MQCRALSASLLFIVSGVLGGISAIVPIPSITKTITCFYCFVLGIVMMLFELSNSPKTNRCSRQSNISCSSFHCRGGRFDKLVLAGMPTIELTARCPARRSFFRTNLGFYMTYNGRATFLIL